VDLVFEKIRAKTVKDCRSKAYCIGVLNTMIYDFLA